MRFGQAIDWAFRSRATGRITLGQWPNLPLWLFIGSSVLARLPALPEAAARALHLGADLALAWWALDEIVRGVNPWRRFLGAAALAGYAWLRLRG